MNILITGFRGTGKTATGEILARRMKKEFIDTDKEIEKQTGMRINEIIWKKGWEWFRGIEKRILMDALRKEAVIAAGGGALTENNIRIGKKKTKVILLTADTLTISKRIAESHRPSLTGKGTLKEIEEVLKKREKKYMEAADAIIDTTEANQEEVAKLIENFINARST